MIKEILTLLKNANGETENIRLAQGMNKLPENIQGVFVKYKKERRWSKKQ